MKHHVLKRILILSLLLVSLVFVSGCSSQLSAVSSSLSQLFSETTVRDDSCLPELTDWLNQAVTPLKKLFGLKAEEEPTLNSSIIPDQYHVLLIGSDRRDDSWNGNSDVMILVSLNRTKKTISFVSFMRDTGVNITNCGYGKLNSAFARGGGPLLKSTLENNFQISINNYIATDFVGMANIIDLFGGVDLDITEPEIPIINNCVSGMAKQQGKDPSQYYLTSAGYQHLDGIQAVGYMRDRSVGNSDFQRTERQRIVLQKLAEKLKELSIVDVLKISTAAAKETWQHDFTPEQIAGLAAAVLECRDYSIVMDRIPYDGLYTSNNENLDPVWPETIARLHATIY